MIERHYNSHEQIFPSVIMTNEAAVEIAGVSIYLRKDQTVKSTQDPIHLYRYILYVHVYIYMASELSRPLNRPSSGCLSFFWVKFRKLSSDTVESTSLIPIPPQHQKQHQSARPSQSPELIYEYLEYLGYYLLLKIQRVEGTYFLEKRTNIAPFVRDKDKYSTKHRVL